MLLMRSLSMIILKVSPENVNPIMMLMLRVHEIVDTRLASNVNKNDYVKILINAQVDKLEDIDESDRQPFENTKTRVQKNLTKAVNYSLN
jgi:hypothetical protein